jgi:hypothetical protein
MRPRSLQTESVSRLGGWPRWALVVGPICVLAVAGCEEEARTVGKRPETRALDQTGVSVGLDDSPRAPAPAAAKIPVKQTGPIIGQRTAEIRDANAELRQGGARPASPRIIAKDPITVTGNAYVSIVGRASVLKIQQAVDLYHAANDRYPKDLDEFMAEVIKANNIALPQLPTYQKYGYDSNEHKLIVLEYPDLKN